MKGMPVAKEAGILFPLAGDKIVCVENLKESTKTAAGSSKWVSQGCRTKSQVKKSIVLTYTNNKQMDKILFKLIFTKTLTI